MESSALLRNSYGAAADGAGMGNTISGSQSKRAHETHERDVESVELSRKGPSPPASRAAAARTDRFLETERSSPNDRALCDFARQNASPDCGVRRSDTTAFIRGKGDATAVATNDVKQGEVGDCYLMAALAALAQTPAGRQRIHDMIHETERAGGKVYTVTFREPVARTAAEFARGLPPYREVEIEVDTFDARRAQDGDAAAGAHEVWPAVIEAAYAKFRGGHAHISDGGPPAHPMTVITGMPATHHAPTTIPQQAAAGRPCTVTIPRGTTDAAKAMVARNQLRDWHCYSVTRSFQKGGETFVELRNPWGAKHPTPVPLKDLVSLGAVVTVAH